MKKYILIVALLLAIIVFTSCAIEAQPAKITEHQPYTAKGDDGSFITGDISELSFIVEEDSPPTSFPVFVDQYPFGQGGPLFDINQPMIDFMTEKLTMFLKLLYGDRYLSIGTIKPYDLEMSHKVRYYTGETWISSGFTDISMITSDFGIIDDILSGNLLENTLIKAMLKYKNIKNPKIVPVITYDVKGELYEYVYMLTETTDDFFEDVLNTNFSYIRVSYGPSASGALLIINEIGTSDLELASNESVISYEEAKDYIQTTYDVEDENSINAEVYYSYSVEQGYIIPCYKFYVEDSAAGVTSDGGGITYDVIHIPMTPTKK